MTDTEMEQRLRELGRADTPPSSTARPIDTAAAWRELRALRSRSVTTRRRALAAAAAIVVAILGIAVPVLSRYDHGGSGPATGTGPVKTYPDAVVGRLPFSNVESLAGDAGHVWVIRMFGAPVMPATYRLTGVDLRDNSVMFTTNLGKDLPSIAVGDGRLWITTPRGQGRGQIERLDLATGQLLSTIHLPAGPCQQIAFSGGRLFAACSRTGSPGSDLWSIDPVSQQPSRLAGPMPGRVISLTAVPGALWYTRTQGVMGLVTTSGRPHAVQLPKAWYKYVDYVGAQLSVAYDDGSVWLLRSGELLARLDPRTGHIQKRFSYRDFDPRRAGGLDFLTAGGGWLWFLDNGYPFSGVLRVSETTGRPAGGVRIPPGSCGQRVCTQVFYTPGAVWVPTANLLIRIDTSRLPG
jgi:streptogramin lyase